MRAQALEHNFFLFTVFFLLRHAAAALPLSPLPAYLPRASSKPIGVREEEEDEERPKIEKNESERNLSVERKRNTPRDSFTKKKTQGLARKPRCFNFLATHTVTLSCSSR